ncbi:MAG: hypothetical protein IJU35_01455 [Paludibacteraceae bacterium]|nr:hypothetical protein [Paludibacteraceae bacterium]
MDTYSDIKRKLQEICHNSTELFHIAQVLAVTGDTCDVMIGGTLKISGVRLRAAQDNAPTGILVKPTIGSYIIIADLSEGNKTSFAAIMFSQIDSITINQGNNGGLIKIKELTDKLNNLVDEVNSLKDTFNGHIHEGTGYAAFKLTITTPTSQASDVSKFKKDDYEDTKVKH